MPFLLDKLRGSAVSVSRLQDNIQGVLNLVGAIASGQLVTGFSVSVPSVLPATFTVNNPLGHKAQGAIIVQQSQTCALKFLSSSANSLTFSLSLVPKSQDGVIYGLSPLTGTLTMAFWVF